MADPNITLTNDTGAVSGRAAQVRTQSILATSHVGPGGFLIEPDTYMGTDYGQKATSFGTHASGGVWRFKALTYRTGGASWTHGGVVDYPIP